MTIIFIIPAWLAIAVSNDKVILNCGHIVIAIL